VVLRSEDTYEAVKEKVRLATIIGTLQCTLTNFRFLRSVWTKNATEERLLGVSFTGIMDHVVFSNRCDNVAAWSGDPNINSLEALLDNLHDFSHRVNEDTALLLGINKSGHIGVIKPEGTASLLTGTSSGIHPRYAPYYIRRVRNDKKDPLSRLLIDEKVPYVEVDDKYIFSFFIKSPEHSVVQKDIGAMAQLELWRTYKKHWCDGNPSQTIYYTDDDYFAIADWLWKNWEDVGGLSFFPYTDASDGVYKNAPLEAITEDEYKKLCDTFPKEIKWERLSLYEKEDFGETSKTLACAGGLCELHT
jgi:ribonucleoside-diphosphate reductase alpha chain